jgi:hypothetical protein
MIKQGLSMWGEVFIELRNAKTGIIEKRVHGKNTLMSRFIDSILGMTGNAWGIGGPGVTDQRHAWNKLNFARASYSSGVPSVSPISFVDFPQIIAVGSGTTPFTPLSLSLNAVDATSYRNTYRSREGGGGQNVQDNIYLKLSRAYDQNEANGTINELGLYGQANYTVGDILGIRNGNTMQHDLGTNLTATDRGWETYNIITGIAFDLPPGPGGNTAEIISCNRRETLTNQWDSNFLRDVGVGVPQNGIVQIYDPLALLSVHDPIVYSVEPKWNSTGPTIPFAIGDFLSGIVLPESIVKNGNQTMSVIWLIHFDAV